MNAKSAAACTLALGLSLLLSGNSLASEPCRTVHGRMSFYNGAPSVRIWIVGSKRVLGVHDGNYSDLSYLPANVRTPWEGSGDVWSHSVYGDFRVCPLTPEHHGWMQIVRVESGRNLRIQPN